MSQAKSDHKHYADRLARIWNEINPDNLAEAKGIGWVFPEIEGVAPTEQEISHYLIDVFNKTGRIIMADKIGVNSFKKTAKGHVVCMNPIVALQLENRVGDIQSRRMSMTSLKTWDSIFSKYYTYLEYEPNKPIKNTVRALLFIKMHRPDIDEVAFLKKSSFMIDILATASYGIRVEHTLNVLKQYKPITISGEEKKEGAMDLSNS